MTALTSPTVDYLSDGRGWQVWASMDADIVSPDEGWKLHIAAPKVHAQSVLNRLATNVFFKERAAHKHWKNTDPIGNPDDNGGKWLVVYPDSLYQTIVVASLIEHEMTKMGIAAPPDGTIPYEIKLGKGYSYTRYGSYYAKGIKAEGGEGFQADVREQAKPAWMENVFLRYGQLVAAPGSRGAIAIPGFSMAELTRKFPQYGWSNIPKEFRGV